MLCRVVFFRIRLSQCNFFSHGPTLYHNAQDTIVRCICSCRLLSSTNDYLLSSRVIPGFELKRCGYTRVRPLNCGYTRVYATTTRIYPGLVRKHPVLGMASRLVASGGSWQRCGACRCLGFMRIRFGSCKGDCWWPPPATTGCQSTTAPPRNAAKGHSGGHT